MDNTVFYCFQFSEDDIKQDYFTNGKSLTLEKIKTEKQFGRCRCAVKNPKGK